MFSLVTNNSGIVGVKFSLMNSVSACVLMYMRSEEIQPEGNVYILLINILLLIRNENAKFKTC